MQDKNNSKKPKPTKDPFILFYIVWPIQTLLEYVANHIKKVWRCITGAWYCNHCERYHGRRVHRYMFRRINEQDLDVSIDSHHYMCSLGMMTYKHNKEQAADAASKLSKAMRNVAAAAQELEEDLAN